MRVLCPGGIEICIGFRRGRKTAKTGEKPSEQGDNQQQTRPTYGPWQESTRATLVGGEP